jgi:hypothetical protein
MYKRLFLTIVIASMALGTSTFGKQPSTLAQDTQDRVVTKLRRRPMPVEVKVVKTKKATIEIGQSFSDEDDWFDGLTVSVKNTSGKTIIYLGGGFLFPRPKDGTVEQDAPPRYHRFMYGHHPLAPEAAVQAIQPVSIKPGETFNITISAEDYVSIKRRLNELGYVGSIKEINFNIEEIYFADGMGWRVGHYLQ